MCGGVEAGWGCDAHSIQQLHLSVLKCRDCLLPSLGLADGTLTLSSIFFDGF